MTIQIKTIEKVFEGFNILEQYTEGSTATIYKVEDENRKLCCIKVYEKEKAEVFPGEEYIKEFHLVGHNIPFLVKVFDVGKYIDKGVEVHYSLMEYVEGTALDDYIKTNTYDSAFVKNLSYRLRKATDILLEKNIAHRDIKTSNVVINSNGDAVLVDLGLLSKTDTENLTDKEKAFLDEELNEVLGSSKPLDKEMLPLYWRMITLFQIGRVINDVIIRKRKITFSDIKVYIDIEYEIRMLSSNNKKYIAVVTTLKHLLKLIRRRHLKMEYFN